MSYKRLHIDNKTMKIHKLSKKINRERNRKIEPNILELKIIINGMKKKCKYIYRLNHTEQRICELENRSFDIIQSEEKKE